MIRLMDVIGAFRIRRNVQADCSDTTIINSNGHVQNFVPGVKRTLKPGDMQLKYLELVQVWNQTYGEGTTT
ncbi:hypothetical protein FRC15_004327 [Serendipita sp. 397]|nr:hypothetical protein FRC15_004327 [Serendipita sp. 397]